ncbi:MAG TPA: hypothetical protein VK957_00170 [Lunatimonas sp.]|nr:hypothetical protein [Lunatimonas sp.]
MKKLKSINPDGISRALEKGERYRLLNEPDEAESICRDILAVDENNQEALVMFILALSDQFGAGVGANEAWESVNKLTDEYKKFYYSGIIKERQAKASLNRGSYGSGNDAFEWIHEALAEFEKAADLRPAGNEDAILRYNACIRYIQRHKLRPPQREQREPLLE